MQAIVATMGSGGDRATQAVQRVDDAVVVGLRALGFPRGPVRRVVIEGGLGPFGRKEPDCTLKIFGDQMRAVLGQPDGPDSLFRTWIHESIHARQRFAVDHEREYQPWRGYEEGMTEGLARLLVRNRAGMRAYSDSYGCYVVAYETLAIVVGIELEQLWQRLWGMPLGAVRSAFVGTIDGLRRESIGQSLAPRQREQLQGIADSRFGSHRRTEEPPAADAMMVLWEIVFR